jgi:hypothetical protein
MEGRTEMIVYCDYCGSDITNDGDEHKPTCPTIVWPATIERLTAELAAARAELAALKDAARWVIEAWGTDEWRRPEFEEAITQLKELVPQLPPLPEQEG